MNIEAIHCGALEVDRGDPPSLEGKGGPRVESLSG